MTLQERKQLEDLKAMREIRYNIPKENEQTKKEDK